MDPLTEVDLAAAGADAVGIFFRNHRVIDDAGLGRGGPGCRRSGFDLANLLGAEAAEAVEAVGGAASVEFLEAGDLVGSGG